MKQIKFSSKGIIYFILVVLVFSKSSMSYAAPRFVGFTSGDMLLTDGTITISCDQSDAKAVAIAVKTLAADFARVTGKEAQLGDTPDAKIIVGTLGKSLLINQLVKQKKLDASLLKDKRE